MLIWWDPPLRLPWVNKEIQRLVQLGGRLRWSQDRKKACKSWDVRDCTGGLGASGCLSVRLSVALIYTLLPVLAPSACWPNPIAFICPDFAFSSIADQKKASFLKTESVYQSQRVTLAQFALCAYPLDQSQLPRRMRYHRLACVGPQALFSWGWGLMWSHQYGLESGESIGSQKRWYSLGKNNICLL